MIDRGIVIQKPTGTRQAGIIPTSKSGIKSQGCCTLRSSDVSHAYMTKRYHVPLQCDRNMRSAVSVVLSDEARRCPRKPVKTWLRTPR